MVGEFEEVDPFVPACAGNLFPDPMGVSGGAAPTPNYIAAQSAMAQQWMQAQNVAPQARAAILKQASQGLGGLGGWGASGLAQQASTHTVTVIPIAQVTRDKINKLIEQLPMRVVVGISSINFYSEEPMRFVVVYTNMRTLEFYDIDEFPSDAHVSRVLLDSP